MNDQTAPAFPGLEEFLKPVRCSRPKKGRAQPKPAAEPENLPCPDTAIHAQHLMSFVEQQPTESEVQIEADDADVSETEATDSAAAAEIHEPVSKPEQEVETASGETAEQPTDSKVETQVGDVSVSKTEEVESAASAEIRDQISRPEPKAETANGNSAADVATGMNGVARNRGKGSRKKDGDGSKNAGTSTARVRKHRKSRLKTMVSLTVWVLRTTRDRVAAVHGPRGVANYVSEVAENAAKTL